MVVTITKAFILFRRHCEPEGRACTPKCLSLDNPFVQAYVTARWRGNLDYVQIASSFHSSQ
jgi:hypothetical protein